MNRILEFVGFAFVMLLLSVGHACARDEGIPPAPRIGIGANDEGDPPAPRIGVSADDAGDPSAPRIGIGADDEGDPPAPQIGVSAGMGVSYLAQQDLVDMINGAYNPGRRIDNFHAAVDFFGSVVVPLSAYWAVRAEYAYLLNTYNVSALLGPGEFTTVVHMPSIIVEYILIQETFYNLSGGIGGGYHFGSLDLTYGNLRDSYTANGPGMVVVLNGNTAMSEDLFVHLAVNARWEFLGELRNSNDRSPGVGSTGSPASLGSFGVGARLGVTYYF